MSTHLLWHSAEQSQLKYDLSITIQRATSNFQMRLTILLYVAVGFLPSTIAAPIQPDGGESNILSILDKETNFIFRYMCEGELRG